MFRKAYVRGVNAALIKTGAVKWANEEIAAEAADAVAETLPEQPVGDVAPEATAEIAATLVDLSNKLDEASESAANAAESVATTKAAEILRRKLSEQPEDPTGTTITGMKPEQENTLPLAETGEAKMEAGMRPEGYANVGEAGVGTQQASGEGAVGKEQVHGGVGMGPVAMDGTNSATEATAKAASLRERIRKMAMGTTITGTNPAQENTQGQAAPQTGEAAMEAAERPEGYAVKGEAGVGQSDQQAKERAGAVGNEQAHPGAPAGPVGEQGTNSAIQQIAGKTAADTEWLNQFKKVAAEHYNTLPFYLSETEKVAAIQYLMSQSPSERQSIANFMSKSAEMPEGLKNYLASKGNGEKKDEDKKDEKKKKDEDKKDDEEKTASARTGDIVDRLRALQA